MKKTTLKWALISLMLAVTLSSCDIITNILLKKAVESIKPTAVIKLDQNIFVAGTTISLDGSYSENADTYEWKITDAPQGVTVNITNMYGPNASFTPTIAGGYGIRLTVSNSSGTDSVSKTINVTASNTSGNNLPIPANVLVSNITPNSAVVSWNMVNGADGYLVYYSISPQINEQMNYPVMNPNQTTVTLPSLNPNTTYYVWVAAVKASSSGPINGPTQQSPQTFTTLSNGGSQTVKLATPQNISISNVTSSGATISWSPVMNAWPRYRVYYSSSNLFSNAVANNYFYTSDYTSFTLTTLDPNTTYYIWVTVYYVENPETESDPQFNSFSFTTSASVTQMQLLTPMDLQVIGNPSSNQATISWQAEAGADWYYVYYSESNDPLTMVYSSNASTSSTQTTLSGLTPNTTYYVWVTAYNTNNINSESPVQITPLSFTTPQGPQVVKLDTPQNILVSNITSYGADISWSPVANAQRYWVYYSTTNDFNSANYTSVQNATSFVFDTLYSGSDYYIWVTADDGQSYSTESDPQVSPTNFVTFAQVTLP